MANPAYAASGSGGGPPVRKKKQSLQPEHVAGVRMVLRKHGFDVDAKGKLTDRLLKAWKAYRKGVKGHAWNTGEGQRNPAYAAKGLGGEPSAVSRQRAKQQRQQNESGKWNSPRSYTPKSKSSTKASKPAATAPKGSKPKSRKSGGGNSVNIGGLGIIAKKTGTKIPANWAEEMAGYEFNPELKQLGIEQTRSPVRSAQRLADIANWNQQVLGSQATAASRDREVGAAGTSSVRDAVARIVQSLGGGANEGAGLVGAAGADAANTLASLAATQNQYNEDIRPLLSAEAGAYSQQERIRAANEQDDMRNQVAALLAQRGQAKAKYGMDIRQANNAIDQQRFQNELALEQAKEAALMTGLKVMDTRSNMAYRNAAAKANTAKTKSGWLSLPGQSRNAAVNAALGFAIKQHSNGNVVDWKAVQNTALAYLRGSGFGSARKLSYKGHIPNKRAQGDINTLMNLYIAHAKSNQQ